jgi:hypothetical protein
MGVAAMPTKFDIREEASTLFNMMFPSMVVQLFLRHLFPTTASVVGRQLDTKFLADFSLGSVVGRGALSTAHTLKMPRAHGIAEALCAHYVAYNS